MPPIAEDYLMVLCVPAYRIDDSHFAIESAFATHLKLLKSRLGSVAKQFVVAAPTMAKERYESAKTHLGVIDEQAEGIRFAPMFENDWGRLTYLLKSPATFYKLYQQVRKAAVVHAGISSLYRPFEFPALMMAAALSRATISVTDIDNRNTPRMNYEAGRWGWRETFVAKSVHGSAAHIQHLICTRACSLVLMKGEGLVRDYGKNRPNVKYFLDAAFFAPNIIPEARLAEKRASLARADTPLEICYFGRLVDDKGIDHMVRALAHAKKLGLSAFRFHLVGAGESEAALRRLVAELGLEPHATFHGAVPFDDAFFERLYGYHILLAAPLKEDTPRSALDAMASGQAIVAYDTYYYRELEAGGAGVEVVPWRDIEALGRRLLHLDRNRGDLVALIGKGVTFAKGNTQEIWLDRRVQWTKDLMAKRAKTPAATLG